MAITSLDGLIASSKQLVALVKTAARTTVATVWFSTFDLAGNPSAGTLAGTSTTVGVVPTKATVGCPSINSFVEGAKGYITSVEFSSTAACRLRLCDMLFKAGAYTYAAATVSLSGQPSFASRLPNGDYACTEIWIEVVTAFVTGTAWQVAVTYTNQDGVSGRQTPAVTAMAAAALTAGKMLQLPLQAGDTGVQNINSVIITNGGTAMTAGTFNVLILRPLWTGRVRSANDGDAHDFTKTGMPEVSSASALVLLVAADSTSSGVPELLINIANG